MKKSLTSTIKCEKGSSSFLVQPKKKAITIFFVRDPEKGLFAICLRKVQLMFIVVSNCFVRKWSLYFGPPSPTLRTNKQTNCEQ